MILHQQLHNFTAKNWGKKRISFSGSALTTQQFFQRGDAPPGSQWHSERCDPTENMMLPPEPEKKNDKPVVEESTFFFEQPKIQMAMDILSTSAGIINTYSTARDLFRKCSKLLPLWLANSDSTCSPCFPAPHINLVTDPPLKLTARKAPDRLRLKYHLGFPIFKPSMFMIFRVVS